MNANLYARLQEHAQTNPRKAAFIFQRGAKWETCDFQKLFLLSEQFAGSLSAQNLRAGQRAILLTPPSPEFFALAFALLKLGIVAILVDPAIGLRRVTACINECQPKIFIGNTLTHTLRNFFGWGTHTLQHNITIRQLQKFTDYQLPDQSLQSPVSNTPILQSPILSSSAAIIYTSGSTGLPKGAIYSHENFSAQLEMLNATFHIGADEVDLPAFPVFALIDILLGATAVIPDMRFPPPAKADAKKIVDSIRRFNVTNMFASPILLDRVTGYATKNRLALPSLKRVITAGAPAPVSVLERATKFLPHAKIFGIYGATESLPIAVINSREILSETRPLSAQGAGVCIGKPVTGATVRIIPISNSPILTWDASLELPANQVGEITVKGKAVTKEYVARAEANRLAKIDDDGETVHRMGDLGYFDEQGRLWYCGRKSHRVETSRGTLFTEQIEGIFNEHPEVYRTALVGVGGEAVLWVQPASGADEKRLVRELIALAQNHPQAAQIKKFLFMKNFPTDVRHNSKIIREKLTLLAEKK